MMQTKPDRFQTPGESPMVVFLHFLGGSRREWSWVTADLARRFRCLTIDLPGFGDASAQTGYDVTAMADAVASAIEAQQPTRWTIVGHSMGAKVAAVVARRAEDGAPELAGLAAVVTLAGSPPAPEPMDETRRTDMLEWLAGAEPVREARARQFIHGNVGAPLSDPMRRQAVDDVLRSHPDAWRHWLQHGSREDWAERIGVLQTPALIVAGEADGDLGPDAQARLMARHFASSRLVTLPGAGHLLPMERAEAVAALITEVTEHGAGAASLTRNYRALIDSDRVSARTRAILLDRAERPVPAALASVLSPDRMGTLRAVLGRVVPQDGPNPIDLAASIAATLATGPGDGWRYAVLPPDGEAYRRALGTLDAAANVADGCFFASLDPGRQDAMLGAIEAETLAVPSGEALLDAAGMALWFKDLLGAAATAYVSHPRTMARLGFSGIANGGDGVRKQGFVSVGPNQREPWEPVSLVESAR